MNSDFDLHLNRAYESLNTSPDYTILLCRFILKKQPGYLSARRLLRQAQASLSQPYWKRLLTNIAIQLAVLVIRSPHRRMTLAEVALTQNTQTAWAHRLLAKSAQKLNLWDTAVFAYESMQGLKGETLSDRLQLCESYLKTHNTARAITLSDYIFKQNPHCIEALHLSRKASVREALSRGMPNSLPTSTPKPGIIANATKNFIDSHSQHDSHQPVA